MPITAYAMKRKIYEFLDRNVWLLIWKGEDPENNDRKYDMISLLVPSKSPSIDLMCHLLMPIAKRGSRGKAEVQLGVEGTYGFSLSSGNRLTLRELMEIPSSSRTIYLILLSLQKIKVTNSLCPFPPMQWTQVLTPYRDYVATKRMSYSSSLLFGS